jgi:glycosyltransferase A (GT-A) superfamily protein (DUF2064 family)
MPVNPEIQTAAVSVLASLITAIGASIIRAIEKGALERRLERAENAQKETQISTETKNKDNDATPAL